MLINSLNTSLMYEGVMTEIYISGCIHNCDECHNPELQQFDVGFEMSYTQIVNDLLERHEFFDGIVLTGGDPLCTPKNTNELIDEIRDKLSDKKIWLYTGYTMEEINDNEKLLSIFNKCDVVFTDRFEKTMKCKGLTGSSNQRRWNNIIEV